MFPFNKSLFPREKHRIIVLLDRLGGAMHTLMTSIQHGQVILCGEGDEATFGRVLTPGLEEARRILDEVLVLTREHSLAPPSRPPARDTATMQVPDPRIMSGVGLSFGAHGIVFGQTVASESAAQYQEPPMTVAEWHQARQRDPLTYQEPPKYLKALGVLYRRQDHGEDDA